MKRAKQLTKRERKAMAGPRPGAHEHHHQHIHCIACGRHLEQSEFTAPLPTAKFLTCDHGSTFPACVGCEMLARDLIATHDRTGRPVQTAGAWH